MNADLIGFPLRVGTYPETALARVNAKFSWHPVNPFWRKTFRSRRPAQLYAERRAGCGLVLRAHETKVSRTIVQPCSKPPRLPFLFTPLVTPS